MHCSALIICIKNPICHFTFWLRMLAAQRLVDLHRRHLGARETAMRRAEVSLQGRLYPAVSSVSLAACLATQFESPSQVLMRKELSESVEQALEKMEPSIAKCSRCVTSKNWTTMMSPPRWDCPKRPRAIVTFGHCAD